MNIRDDIFLAVHESTGQIYRTNNGRSLFTSLGPLKNSLRERMESDLIEQDARQYKLKKLNMMALAESVAGLSLFDIYSKQKTINDLKKQKIFIENKLSEIQK